MKKIFAVISAFFVLFACTISAYAVHPSGGGFSDLYSWTQPIPDGMVSYGNYALTPENIPDNYVFCARSGGYGPSGNVNSNCDNFELWCSGDLDHLNGSVNSSGYLTIYTPDNSRFYLSRISIKNPEWEYVGNTNAYTVSNSGSFASGTFQPGYWLTCNLPIYLDDGSVIAPPISKNFHFQLSGYMDDKYIRHYEVKLLDTQYQDYGFRVFWMVYNDSCPYGVEYVDDSNDYTISSQLKELGEDVLSSAVAPELVADKIWASAVLPEYLIGQKFVIEDSSHYGDMEFAQTVLDGALPYGQRKSSVALGTSGTIANYSFYVNDYYYNMSRNFSLPSNVCVVAMVVGQPTSSDNSEAEVLAILGNRFNVEDILSTKGASNIGYEDTHVPWTGEDTENPTFSGSVEDIQSLSDFAKFLARFWSVEWDNLAIMINNMVFNMRNQLVDINWHDLIGTGVGDYFFDLLNWLSNNEVDTDYDLTSLVREITPLFDSTTLSLPDLSTALAPVIASADLDPSGSFVPHLDSLFGDTQLSLGGIDTTLGNIDTQLGDLALDVGGITNEIDVNARAVLLPDKPRMDTRLDLSANRLKNKFTFASDVKDIFDDVREKVENASDSPPEWAFTWKNKRMVLVDWSGYSRVRITIQNILLAIAYVLLAKYIYRTLPTTLNGGGDGK